jgi:macrodomain Ter protein organizer (MatP/YcbG family)
MSKKKKKSIHIELPEYVHDLLRESARKNKRSMTQEISVIVETHCRREMFENAFPSGKFPKEYA